MFYKKPNFPEKSELVICTVKKILFHSIFVTLDEYIDKEGLIHISEVSPGRIRNLRDYVKENKRIVCKVLNINQEKNLIELSLRRVTSSMKKNKLQEYKQEDRVEKILEFFAEKTKSSLKDVYQRIGNKIIQEYGLLTLFFQAALKDQELIKKLNLPKKDETILIELIKERIKLPEVKIYADLILKSNAPNGIKIIKETLKATQDFATQKDYKIQLSYITAPKYRITIIASDYKTAEENLKEIAQYSINLIKKQNSFGEFQRLEK